MSLVKRFKDSKGIVSCFKRPVYK